MSSLVEAAVQSKIPTNIFLRYLDMFHKIAIMISSQFTLNLFDG